MCCVILVLLYMRINTSLHTFTGRGNAGCLCLCCSFSHTHTPPCTHTHTRTNTCDVRWSQTGIPHIAPDTPVFLWHFPCRTGTHRQPANLHNSPVDDLHFLKIAPILSVSLSLCCMFWVKRCLACFCASPSVGLYAFVLVVWKWITSAKEGEAQPTSHI